MSRIKQVTDRAAKSGRKLLIPYLVAGDPDLPNTLNLMHTLVKQGADIIELGIPFSDPSSDGPIIQKGVERALASGTTLRQVLSLVTDFRHLDQKTPLVLMGYLNPIEIMGYENFAQSAATAGVDGVLVVDMPLVESSVLRPLLQRNGIDTIFLVAPTTADKRIKSITAATSGYLYYVSLRGVTGDTLTDYESVRLKIDSLRRFTDLPIVIGFGIKDTASASAMAQQADGVIIGSALVEQIGKLAGSQVYPVAQLITTTALIAHSRAAIDSIK